jgi:nitrite reductase/ring-hydroxylating ferredoxin subunit
MAEVLAGSTAEFGERDIRVKVVEGREIGIVRLGDEFFAYENVCPHAGGPVCQGRLMGRVEEQIAEDRTSLGACFSRRDVNIVCPWHGYEYDVRTGQHQAHAGLRLKRFELRLDGDRIYVSL